MLCIITYSSIILALLPNKGRTRVLVGVKARLNVTIYGSRKAGTILKQAGAFSIPFSLPFGNRYEGEGSLDDPCRHPGGPSRNGSCPTTCTIARKLQRGSDSCQRCCPHQPHSQPQSFPGRGPQFGWQLQTGVVGA